MIVGLINTHSLETVIGILGILKAGAAYLPIDPKEPPDRMNFMLADAAPQLLLVNTKLDDAVIFEGDTLDLTDVGLYTGATDNLTFYNNASQLVYVIYTSGSTGVPKGTMIAHQQLVNYIWWAKQIYINDQSDIFALYSSLAFDLTITSIFTPLLCGNTVVIYSDSEDEYVLFRIIRENQVTILKLTPSHLSLLKDGDYRNSSLRRLIVGGENLKVSLARNVYACFGGHIEIMNEYGPTETVVGCMLHHYDYTQDRLTSVPIGGPAHNVQVYVLDQFLKPVPLYSVGELYVSGAGVARGYLNRPELTSERFVPDPFMRGRRMYKTGDLARFIRADCIEYVGRADRQVKVRAHRIELGEIETCLEGHPLIKDAIVVYREPTEDEGHLCGYIVVSAEISPAELRAYVSGYLPAYMIPSRFTRIDAIPLTGNGKIDYNALPDALMAEQQPDMPDVAGSSAEHVLLRTIGDVLQIDDLDLDDHFFHLGGNSIKAIQIAARISRHGLSLKARDILAYPIIRQMALCISHASAAVSQEPCTGIVATTPIVAWFFAQNFTNPHYYNQSVCLRLKRKVAVEYLADAMTALILHHDTLRLNYDAHSHCLFYNDRYIYEKHTVAAYDLADDQPAKQQQRMLHICEEARASLNIEHGMLIKTCVFDLGVNGSYLFLTMHHLIVDAVSWRIICEDLYLLLTQRLSQQQLRLPPKIHSYQHWADQFATTAQTIAQDELSYWQAQTSWPGSWPGWRPGTTAMLECDTAIITVDDRTTHELLTQANVAYGTEVKDLLVTAFAQAAGAVLGRDDLVVMFEGHGREPLGAELDLSRTVGWFTSIYPVHLKLSGESNAADIEVVKEQLRQIPNKGVGFGVLRYLLECLDIDDSRYIRFNYLGEIGAGFDNDLFAIHIGDYGNEIDKRNHLPYVLDINCYIVHRQLSISLTYKRHQWTEETIQTFLTMWSRNLHELISHCLAQNQVEFTPSDFDTVDLSQTELDMLLG